MDKNTYYQTYNDVYNDSYIQWLINDSKWEIETGKQFTSSFNISSVIDLGCGIGYFLEGAKLADCPVIKGLEYSKLYDKYRSEEANKYIFHQDVSIPLEIDRTYDTAWSFEVLEHIPPETTETFLDNITKLSNRLLFLTVARIGQGGNGHINEMNKEDVIPLVEKRNFIYNVKQTEAAVKIANDNKSFPWFYENLMVFEKETDINI